MKKILVGLFVLFSLAGCGESENKTLTDNAQHKSNAATIDKADYSSYVSEGVDYDINEKGVLIFTRAKDMFESLNDYPEDSGELKFISEDPLSLSIHKKTLVGDTTLKEITEISFLYAIYRTFMHTKVDQITVVAYPLTVDKANKETYHKDLTLQATVSRDKALAGLQKHLNADSFNDLVQLEENDQYRTIGVSGSDVWSKLIYDDKKRPDIIKDLMN